MRIVLTTSELAVRAPATCEVFIEVVWLVEEGVKKASDEMSELKTYTLPSRTLELLSPLLCEMGSGAVP